MAAKVSKTCPCCGNPFTGHPNKKFCGQRCKDRWHNATNPRGIQRGNEPYEPLTEAEQDHEDALDALEGGGWDAHKVWTGGDPSGW